MIKGKYGQDRKSEGHPADCGNDELTGSTAGHGFGKATESDAGDPFDITILRADYRLPALAGWSFWASGSARSFTEPWAPESDGSALSK